MPYQCFDKLVRAYEFAPNEACQKFKSKKGGSEKRRTYAGTRGGGGPCPIELEGLDTGGTGGAFRGCGAAYPPTPPPDGWVGTVPPR